MKRLPQVRAAGGVVVRRRNGSPEVLLVHRPRYDDWSLPKGKVEPGETLEAAALREVAEETGLRCELGEPLPEPAPYVDNRGRVKSVSYWMMTVIGGEFEPNGEVDEIRWCTAAQAAELLSYERDCPVVISGLAQYST